MVPPNPSPQAEVAVMRKFTPIGAALILAVPPAGTHPEPSTTLVVRLASRISTPHPDCVRAGAAKAAIVASFPKATILYKRQRRQYQLCGLIRNSLCILKM
jgi:transposase